VGMTSVLRAMGAMPTIPKIPAKRQTKLIPALHRLAQVHAGHSR
jgi:hypothetical protein